jgi:asparagine synthase (glutamine-hydrolysing)
MCGICGFVTSKTVTEDQLKNMNDTMVHRGPDDAGQAFFAFLDGLHVGLAHRRLSIVDLSANGHQPFHSKNDDVIVVFNGEIYNFQHLKREMSEYRFCTECDTEVIIAAYEKWGTHFVEYLDGMFAIALLDRKKHLLILARDRIGKKPLYYYWENGEFVFGSGLTPIMHFPGFEKRIHKAALQRFLYNQYMTGEDCAFEGVSRMNPGEMLIFDGKGIQKTRYWDLVAQYKKSSQCQIRALPRAKAQLKEALTEAVRRRLVADVPVGTFLSGGYDSSVVTAIAQSLSDTPIKTFSIGFEEKEYDEAPYAAEIAAHLGTNHTNHYVTEAEMLELVSSIPRYYDEPFADASQIPSMLVAEIARKEVTVALTGDGGDEFFCGYGMYDKLAQAQKLEPLAKVLRVLVGNRPKLLRKLPYAVRAILENSDERHKTQFGRRGYAESIAKMLGCDPAALPYDESYIPVSNWQVRRMLLDSTTYLPGDNLCKVDRATMRSSLEARNPLLDVSVISTAFQISHGLKYHKKDKKYILKELTHDYIPQALMDRPKKGFSVPTDKWLRGPLKEDLLQLTSEDYLKKQGIFDPEYTHQYVLQYLQTGNAGAFSGNNPSKIVWPLYMFQKWYAHYMD